MIKKASFNTLGFLIEKLMPILKDEAINWQSNRLYKFQWLVLLYFSLFLSKR